MELKDISDPLEEFYEDEEDDEEDEETNGEEGEVDNIERRKSAGQGTMRPPAATRPVNDGTATGTTTKPTFIDTRLPPLHSGITTPFLSRSNTPGIPGGTSNFSYFHLPLSSGMPGTHTPLPFSPANPWGEHHRSGSPVRYQQHGQHGHSQLYNDPNSRPATGTSHTLPTSPAFAAPQPSTPTSISHDRSQDLQTTLHIYYSGSLSLSLTAEILLDYPMPSFVGIPLKLHITGLSFDGVALLAYLRQPDKNTAHFCFMGAEDAEALLGDGELGMKGEDGEGMSGMGGKGSGGDRLGGLLKEIRVESEIGRQEGGKQVLKNVGKVEKFVLEQVRRIFEDEFVWPSFWTFLV